MPTATIERQLQSHPLTPELITALCELVGRGSYQTDACRFLGIPYSTFQHWMSQGRVQTEGKYHELYTRIDQAQAASAIYAVESWRSHFQHDWRAAATYLSRRFPEQWGDNKKITIAVEREVTQMLNELQARLPADLFQIVVEEIASVERERALATSDQTDEAIEEAEHDTY